MQHTLHPGGRASSDIKALLKPIAEGIRSELCAHGYSFLLSQIQELVAAGFGFYTLQLLLKSNARLVSHHPQESGYSDEYSQYRTASVELRCSQLGVEASKIPYVAMRVIGHLRKSKVVIDAHDAYANRTKNSKRILSALAAGHDPFRPVNASVALYAGILPLFDLRVFRSIEHYRYSRGALPKEVEVVAEGIASKKIRLMTSALPDGVRFPTPYKDHYEGRDLRRTLVERDATRAVFGSGYCLVMESLQNFSSWKNGPGDTVATQFFSPVAHFSANGGWRFSWDSAFVSTHLTRTKWRDTGPPLMDFRDCPLIEYCSKCDQLYAVDGPSFFVHTCCSH